MGNMHHRSWNRANLYNRGKLGLSLAEVGTLEAKGREILVCTLTGGETLAKFSLLLLVTTELLNPTVTGVAN